MAERRGQRRLAAVRAAERAGHSRLICEDARGRSHAASPVAQDVVMAHRA